MTQQNMGSDWQRNKLGMGVWPHQGEVAIVGWAQSPVDRRWDGVNLEEDPGLVRHSGREARFGRRRSQP